MSADPNANATTTSESNDATTATTATAATTTTTQNPAPEKKGFFDKLRDNIDQASKKADEALVKASVKADEFGKKVNAKMDEVAKQIDKESQAIAKSMERDLNRLNDQANEAKSKEIPDDMAGLLQSATTSLDSQLKVIQEQLTKLREKNMVGKKFQQLGEAKALIFVSQVSAKLIVSGGYGRGIIVAKLADGSWSQPCAIETVEVGAGWQIGVSRARYVIPLYSQKEIDALVSDKGKQVSLTGSMQFAFGNDGRLVKGMLSASDKSVKKDSDKDKIGASSTVADMQGFDIGVGAAVSGIGALREVNKNYYYNVSYADLKMSKILDGTIKAPPVISGDEESKLSDNEKLRNKMVDDAEVQYTILISMLSEGLGSNNDSNNENSSNVGVSDAAPVVNDASKEDQKEGTPEGGKDANASGVNAAAPVTKG